MDNGFFRLSYVAFFSYWTILVVELIGDRSIYMIASFALRYRLVFLFSAIAIVSSIKMFFAVWLGQFLNYLPASYSALVTALIFFLSAIFITFKSEKDRLDDLSWARITRSNVMLPFLSLLFCEWIDAGQISAAALTSRFQLPFATWLGGTAALTSKGILGLVIGNTFRNRIPDRFLRIVCVSSMAILGITSLLKAFQ